MAWFPYGLLLLAIALCALAVLALMLLSLWRRTKVLMSTVEVASEKVGVAVEALLQAKEAAPASARPAVEQPPVDTHRTPARHR